MKIKIIKCLQDNYSYLIVDEMNKNACVIDPSEAKPIINYVEDNNINLKYILNTHHHYDHVGGNQELKKKYKYIFTTGGIGPTHDDITAKSISKAFNLKYEFHKEAYSILEKYYGKIKFNEGRKKMAKMPRGSVLIYNPASAAPGFIINNVFCLPGVPSILKSMISNCIKYLIKGSKILRPL